MATQMQRTARTTTNLPRRLQEEHLNETHLVEEQEGAMLSLSDDCMMPYYRPTFKMVLTWYLIARAFDRGSSHRRALPLELILAIFHYTDFFVPITDLGSHSKKPIKVTASSYAVVRKAWFESPVLDTATLARVVGCQLRTSSRDQGWADRPEAGSWTWFELSLERPREAEQPLHHARMFRTLDEAVGEDQWREVRWRSHCNRTANQLRHNLSGLRFERGHEIWRLARAGDRIAVTVCAQYGAWSNDAESGVLELWARFVPSCI